MLRELVVKNRSYRGYDRSRAITRQELEQLVDLTRYTASSINIQPLKYHIACQPEQVAEIQKLTKWAAALPKLSLPYPGTEPVAFITICQDTNIHSNTSRFLRDIGAVAQTMLLGAVEMGLGGCMIGNFDPVKLSALLGFPENIVPNLIVAFGKPDEDIRVTDLGPDGGTDYYRDEDGKVHFVPKRSLEEILI